MITDADAVKDAESRAASAASTWSIEATPFVDPPCALRITKLFEERGDVIAHRIAGGRRTVPSNLDDDGRTKPGPTGEGRRCRFVIMHPDLGLDAAMAEAEYATMILAENVNVASSNTFPNALASIGVHLDDVGDIVVLDSSTVYFVVDPRVAKRCLRLLSKELVGTGINLSACEPNEFMPDGGVVQEMKLSRILERQMERKKFEQGFVQFS